MAKTCAIILNYFGYIKTCRCVESLSNEAINLLLIIDNSANADEFKRLKHAIERIEYNADFGQVVVLSVDENLGFAGGVNFGVSWVEEYEPCDYYLLINNDAYASKGLVARLSDFLVCYPETALVAPIIKSGQDVSGLNWYRRWIGSTAQSGVSRGFPWLSGCCLLLSKTYFDNNIFDECFFMYGEDVELCWRLFENKINYQLVEDACVYHDKIGSSYEGGLFYEYHLNRGHILLSVRLIRSKYEIPFLLLSKLSFLFFRSILRCFRFNSMTPFFSFLLSIIPLKIRSSKR